MHPRRLLGIIFTFSGLIFIPNMIQDIHKYITGELGLPIFDIAINLFLVPLYFFYFRKLTKPEKLTSRRIWPHLMPGISVLITSFFLSPLQEKVAGNGVFLNANLPLIIFRCASLILQAIMITVYTLRILHLKREHMQRLEENYSFMEDIDLHWLNQAIPLAAFFAFVALFASCFQAIWSDYLFHISSILFTFYLFIHALNEPYICYTEQHAEIHEEEIISPNSCPEPSVTAPTNETELSPVFPALPEKYLKNLGIKKRKDEG